jgi:hypothetical protein
MRPIVKVFVDKYGNKVSPQIIDLKEDRLLRNVTITGVNDIA